MDYGRRLLSTWGFLKHPHQVDDVPESSRLDAYLGFMYKVLLWDDPILTWTTLGAIHVLFWLVVHFEVKLYGFIFTTILAAFILDTYFERTGLQEKRTTQTEALRRCGTFMRDLVLYLKAFRAENPSVFCGTMCAVFLAMSIVARNVSGYFLTYLSILATFFLPSFLQKIPPKYFSRGKDFLNGIASNNDFVAETELIPYLKEFTDRDADADSIVTDKTADSVANSLISGITSMPSHMDREGSLDGLEEDDLIPTKYRSKSRDISDSDSSFSEDSKQMSFSLHHFNKGHVNNRDRELSSDDDDDDEFTRHYTTGLKFTEQDQVDISEVKTAGSNLSVNPSLHVGLNLVTQALETIDPVAISKHLLSSLNIGGASDSSSGGNPTEVVRKRNTHRQDSDSDFEIVDYTEFDDRP